LWYVSSITMKVRRRIQPACYRKQMVALSITWLCLCASVAGAYRWCWRPWFRSCAFRTIQEENFNPHIAPAHAALIRHLTPEEEQELSVWLKRAKNPAARFNAACILAKRSHPYAWRVAADMLLRADSTGAPAQSVTSRYEFPVGLAKAAVMELTGFRTSDEPNPPQPAEWREWKRWYGIQPSLANHTSGDGR